MFSLPKLQRHDEQVLNFRNYLSKAFEDLCSTAPGSVNIQGLETRLEEIAHQYTTLLEQRETVQNEDKDLFVIRQFHPHSHRISKLLSSFSDEFKAAGSSGGEELARTYWEKDERSCLADQDSLDACLRRVVQTRGGVSDLFRLDQERSKEEGQAFTIALKQVRLNLLLLYMQLSNGWLRTGFFGLC